MSHHDRLQGNNQLLETIAQNLRVMSLPAGSDALWHVAKAVASIEEAREHLADAKAPLTLG